MAQYWEALGSGTNSSSNIWALTTLPNGDLIAGGYFSNAGGIQAYNIARWNGAAWFALGSATNSSSNTTYALITLPNGDVVAAGDFYNIGGGPITKIARWNGAAWFALGSASGNALTPLPNGDIIAGGSFTTQGGVPANRVARWNGTTWSPLGAGVNLDVSALATLPNGDVVAGGLFSTAGGLPANHVARWNGTTWSPLGAGVNNTVNALTTLPNGDVVAGGTFTTAGGAPANRVARWNGTAWSPLGAGMNSDVDALTTRPNGDIVAGGFFTTAGGATANHVARWDGTTWSSLGAGVNNTVNALTTLPNGDVVAGGLFTTAGGAPANHVARFVFNCPTIAQQPQAGSTICPQDSATLSVGVAGPACSQLIYNWQWRPSSTASWRDLLGINFTFGNPGEPALQFTTNVSLELPTVTITNFAPPIGIVPPSGTKLEFRCVVGPQCACQQIVSSTAMIEVVRPPEIQSQPHDVQQVEGLSLSPAFTVQDVPFLDEYPRTYTWRRNGTVISGGGPTGWGSTIAMSGGRLDILNVQLLDAGNYDCIIGNSCGSVTSAAAALSVIPFGGCVPAGVTGTVASTSACPTGTRSFSTTATGTGPWTYQWQVQTVPNTWFTLGNDPGALPCGGGASAFATPINSPNVSIGIRPCPGSPGTPQHFQIRCLVTNACASVTSNEATYTICPADFNCSGSVTVSDIFAFLSAWFAHSPAADFNGDAQIQVNDIFAFLSAWFAGC